MEKEIADLKKKNQSLLDQKDKLHSLNEFIQEQNNLIEDSKIKIFELNEVISRSKKDQFSVDYICKTLAEKQVKNQ